MNDIHELQGAGTALVTPFRRNGEIDDESLKKLVDFQIAEGIDFLVPCGTTGESATMTQEEHLHVVDLVVKQSAGRVPVIAGAGGNDTRKTADLARRVAGLGVDGILSVTPYYNKPTQEGLFLHFSAVAEAANIPVILYNVPGRTQCNMLPDTVIRLAAIPNIAGLKAASGDIAQIGEVAIRKPDDFIILSGDDPNTLPIMALGGKGVISVVSNQAPALVHQLAEYCLRGMFKEALQIHARLFDLMRDNFLETNPIPVKAGLEMMGRIEANYRLPLVPMTAANKAKLRTTMIRAGILEN
ncbi:4-hydroxy-tetrahydrodipicolinate synthase [bacterium]|nr:4-hydroxy-tetrahydrodipicolinate synthase [bacterium]